MELDDLKQAWATYAATAERSLKVQQWLLRDRIVDRSRRAASPFVAWRVIEIALGVMALGACGTVLAAHVGELRYLTVGGALLAFVAAVTASSAYLLVHALRIPYGGPVVEAQRAVARIARAEVRATIWTFLGGVVMWLPLALVLFEAVTGIPALGRVDAAWLAANLAFGAVVFGVGRVLARRFVERDDLGPVARRFVEALSGQALRTVSGQLDELAAFTTSSQ